MRKNTLLISLLRSALALAMAAGAFIVAGAASAVEPYLPADDALVLERLPPAADAARGVLQANPAAGIDVTAAAGVARRYLALARAEGDPRLYGYAQGALAPWWQAAEPPPRALLLRAVIRQAYHDFEAALADLDLLLAREPGNVEAALARAAIRQARGEPRLALADCRRLGGRLAQPVPAVCAAAALGRMGRDSAALTTLGAALISAPSGTSPEVLIWARRIEAEVAARLGRSEAAEAAYREALALGVRDIGLLAAYADFLLERGRPAEVRDLLAGEESGLTLLVPRALAERRLGDPALGDRLEQIRADLERARMRGEGLHLREAAQAELWLFDAPAAALDLAGRNWTLQREPADARIVLQAALAAGEPGSARAVLEWRRETGLADPVLDGLAARLAGVTRAAR